VATLHPRPGFAYPRTCAVL